MDIFLLKNNLYIKANKDIDETYSNDIIRKIYSIVYTYKLINIIIDIQNKKLEKKIIKSLNDSYFSFNIKSPLS